MTEVNFTQCAVAFLDILGFKNFIAATENIGSKEFIQFSRLLDAIDSQLQFTTDDGQEQHKFPKEVELMAIHISDSFVLSAPINNEAYPGYSGLIAVAIKTIQLAHQLLDMGFLLRGGIAVGNVYRTPTNIFGTGYQNAYETESTLAETPRVLLHQSAVDRLEGDRHSGRALGEFSIFMRDDQTFILDTLNTHWSYIGNDRNCDIAKVFKGYKTRIEHNLSTLSPGRARDKWGWLAKLFNAKQRDCSDLRDVLPIDLDQYSAHAFGPAIEQSQTTFREAFGLFMAQKRYVKSFSGAGQFENEP